MEYFEKSAIIRLEQMGLKVERTYVKKKKADQKPEKSDHEDSCKENDNESEDAQTSVCMYELEKLNCEADILSDDEDLNIIQPQTADANLILQEENKAILSFDEILDGIVKCNKKNIKLQPESNSETDLELCNIEEFNPRD